MQMYFSMKLNGNFVSTTHRIQVGCILHS